MSNGKLVLSVLHYLKRGNAFVSSFYYYCQELVSRDVRFARKSPENFVEFKL